MTSRFDRLVATARRADPPPPPTSPSSTEVERLFSAVRRETVLPLPASLTLENALWPLLTRGALPLALAAWIVSLWMPPGTTPARADWVDGAIAQALEEPA